MRSEVFVEIKRLPNWLSSVILFIIITVTVAAVIALVAMLLWLLGENQCFFLNHRIPALKNKSCVCVLLWLCVCVCVCVCVCGVQVIVVCRSLNFQLKQLIHLCVRVHACIVLVC